MIRNALVLLGVMSVLAGCKAGGSSAAAPNPGPVKDTGFALRVLCYNIHHANPPSKPGVIDLEAIAAVIRREAPHVVALQEVDVRTERSGSSVHQAEALAAMTGMTAYFGKAIDYGGGEYGVAILSRLPMRGMKNTPLPSAEGTNGEPRTLASAIITLPDGKELLFASTHFDAQRGDTNRLLQAARVRELLEGETLPVVLAGDFNASPDSRIIQALDATFTRTCVQGCGYTIPQVNPTRTIDFIFYRPANRFRVLAHSVVQEPYASDHLPVRAELQLK